MAKLKLPRNDVSELHFGSFLLVKIKIVERRRTIRQSNSAVDSVMFTSNVAAQTAEGRHDSLPTAQIPFFHLHDTQATDANIMATPTPPSPVSSPLVSASTTALFDEQTQLQQKNTQPRRKLRVLCLHGFRTNAQVMISQTKGLRAAMGEEHAEFIFLNAPFEATGPSEPAIEKIFAKDAPFYEWWYASVVDPMPENQWKYSLETFNETVAFMDQKIRELGPIDVVVAFSQGSVLATVISALYSQTRDEVPWKLCVCVGGAELGGVQFREFFETPDGRPIMVPIPSIHIVGRADPQFDEGISLASVYDSHSTIFPASPLKKMVLYHEDGHRFPVPSKYKELYAEVAKRIYEHCAACDDEYDSSRTNNAYARL